MVNAEGTDYILRSSVYIPWGWRERCDRRMLRGGEWKMKVKGWKLFEITFFWVYDSYGRNKRRAGKRADRSQAAALKTFLES